MKTLPTLSRPPRTDRRRPVNVMLLISSLEHGGAERQVVELVRHLDRTRFDPVVCSLSNHVPLARFLPSPNRDLVVVEKRSKYDPTTVPRVARLLTQRGISVVHAFLFDAEMVGRLAAKLAGVPVVIASERNTDYRRPLIHTICQRLTKSWFDVMIANSSAGGRFNMRTLGLPASRIRVIHNGVDVDRFRPGDGSTLRDELGIPRLAPVVGMVAMFKRQKNHGDFFRMAREVLRRVPDAWFVCVGEPLRGNQQGAETYHREMRSLVESLGVAPRCVFLGNRNDMPAVYHLCDVTVLTSTREGTPNVLLESMACGVPVVATDVADNAQVVPDGEVGYVVPLGAVEPMSQRVGDLLTDSRRRAAMGETARRWVKRTFSLAVLARRTEAVYLDLLDRKLAGRGTGRRHDA